MKSTSLITAALLAAGLVTSANASSTVTVGGTTYTEVFITGSTAFRAFAYEAVAFGTVFDSAPTVVAKGGGAASISTSSYVAYGNIGGQPYLLNFDLTGSEAGLAAVYNASAGTSVAVTYPVSGPLFTGTATLAGTPLPTGFVNPTTSGFPANVTAAPDLAFADTSAAVSLNPTQNGTLTDFGIVAVIPFTWAKGYNSAPDASWTDLVNVSIPQLSYELTGAKKASYFTGKTADTDLVYLIGRNKGSGTRVNTFLTLNYGLSKSIVQYAPANSTYSSTVLTAGSVAPITSLAGLDVVGNDGFDSGGGVATTLEDNITGSHLITLGYIGLPDFLGSLSTGTPATALTLDGVAENDGNIINGEYAFWGHEHLYGQASPSTAALAVADALTGYVTVNGGAPNEALGSRSSAAGALESVFGNNASSTTLAGGHEASPNTQSSYAIDPVLMLADKPSDSGYPSQF